jgi:L-fucose isomerase-like protein
VFVGAFVQEEPTAAFSGTGMSFVLFGRGPESQGIEERVCGLLYASSPRTRWIETTDEHAFAVSDALWTNESSWHHSLPSRVVIQGYQRRMKSGYGLDYNELLQETQVYVPVRGQRAWRGRWTCKIASVLSDASSNTAIPDLDYFAGKTALFLLGASRLFQHDLTFVTQVTREASGFIECCISTSNKQTFDMTPSMLPWSVGPMQFVAEQILDSTPIPSDVITSIVMPYMNECVNRRWSTPREDAFTLGTLTIICK